MGLTADTFPGGCSALQHGGNGAHVDAVVEDGVLRPARQALVEELLVQEYDGAGALPGCRTAGLP